MTGIIRPRSKPPNILVVTPTGDETKTRAAQSVEAASRFSLLEGFQAGAYPGISWLPIRGTYPDQGQNSGAGAAVSLNADYVWLVDSDMSFFPAMLRQMLDRQPRDILAVPYVSREKQFRLGLHLDGRKFDGTEKGIVEVQAMPTGCMLVRVEVFRKLTYPWFYVSYGNAPEDFTTGDINFCRKARAHGFKVWADFELAKGLFHEGSKLYGWSDAKPHPSQAEQRAGS